MALSGPDLPFATVLQKTGAPVGSTRFMALRPEARSDFFDLGDLAFCPDYEAEQAWKDRFGKKGLLHLFRPSFGGRTWDGFWGSVERNSARYIQGAERIVEQAALVYPEEQSFVFQDALEYGWIPGFVQDFQAELTQGLWEAGVVRREDASRLDPRHEMAAWRMLEREFDR